MKIQGVALARNSDFSIDYFYQDTDLTPETTRALVCEGLRGSNFGELYHEHVVWEDLRKDMGEYEAISVGGSHTGFGFRVGQGLKVGYVSASDFNQASLKSAISQSRQVLSGMSGGIERRASFQKRPGEELYLPFNPMEGMTIEEKIAAVDAAEAAIQELDCRISNVTIEYSASYRARHVMTADGQSFVDLRPRTAIHIDVQLSDGDGNIETGAVAVGGFLSARDAFDHAALVDAGREATAQADLLLKADFAPSGKTDVVLANGWPSVILHEAVGHGLEGDFNRKGISVYSGKIGQRVAADGVTLVDQGNIKGARGSFHFDDEGTPTQETVLIQDGVLKQYMQDHQNAALMGTVSTGNGRRESFEHPPMPRMTNTFLKPGRYDPEEIIASVDDGLYITTIGDGQVDIVSGNFNMGAKLAFRIRAGKIQEPVKQASVIGAGHEIIHDITMIGNDLSSHPVYGVCIKDEQDIPVSHGQPTIRVKGLTIGGMS